MAEKPNFGAEGAEILKKRGFCAKNGHFWPKRAKFGQNLTKKVFLKVRIFIKRNFFENFENFRKILAKIGPTQKIVSEKCNKNENFGVAKTPQNPTPQISLLFIYLYEEIIEILQSILIIFKKL